MKKENKKIILYAPGHIGDFIWFTSVLSMIQTYKDAKFVLFTSKSCKQLINKNFNIEVVLMDEKKLFHKNKLVRYIYKFLFVFDICKIIKFFKFDSAIFFFTPPGFFIKVFNKLYKIKDIVYGNFVYPGSTVNKKYLKYCSKVIDFENVNNMHIMQKLQLIAKTYFNNSNLSIPILPNTDFLSTQITSLIGKTKKYKIALCSRGSADWKFLDKEFLKSLIENLDKNIDVTFFIVGHGKPLFDDTNMLKDMLPKIDIRSVYNKFNLLAVIEFIKQMDLLVSIDTGTVHIASAVNTSVISLCGPTSPIVSAPISHKGIALYSNRDCSPCDKKINSKNFVCNDMKCLKDISSNQVIEEIKKLLNFI